VRDACRNNSWRGSAAGAGGDVSRRDQVAVAGERAMRAGEDPPGWLGDTFEALGASRGRAALVNQDHGDPGGLGLVSQNPDQVTDAPVTDPPVVPPPRGQGQHATRITHRQSAGPSLDRPADDHGGGFVLGLGHPAPVPRLGQTLDPPVLAPSPRAALTRLGGAAGGGAAAGLGVVVVLAVLGADRPPRHQQSLRARPGDRIRVDDPQIDPGHPGRIGFLPGRVGGDRHFRGHLHPQPPRAGQQGNRTDLGGGPGQVVVQADPQRRAAAGHRNRQHPPVQAERAVIPAHRHHPPAAPREPRGEVSAPAPFRRRKPGVSVTAQHRPGTSGVEFPERARPRSGQHSAQLLVRRQRPGLTRPRQVFNSSTHAHTSPAETSSPVRRRRWPRVSRSPARAVRYTTFGELGSRHLGMLQAHHHPPTKRPIQHPTQPAQVANTGRPQPPPDELTDPTT
jgi:hypothetical protein